MADAKDGTAFTGAQSSKQTTEHIQALAEISKKIPKLLQHAGQSVNALSRNSVDPNVTPSDADSGALAANKTVFRENYTAFLTLLNEIAETLVGEADALVDAKLLPALPPKKGVLGESITNEGLGGLDVGYLNSRTRDVGVAKEAELLKEMKEKVQKLVERHKQADGEAMDQS